LDRGDEREFELYDDVDFYEQLLKEFLESGNDASVASGAAATKHIKRRKTVDRKASKGRKIRYHVQEPLVNFMQANDMEIPTWAERVFTQLFASHA
jgi:protein AATF/BFR2